MSEGKLNINCLPDEVLEQIFRNVDKECRSTLNKVCTRWEGVIESLFGYDVILAEKDLEFVSQKGVHSCIIQDNFSHYPDDIFSQSPVVELTSPPGLKRPRLLQHLRIHPQLQPAQFNKLLMNPPALNLVSLYFTWNSLTLVDGNEIFNKLNLPALKEVTITELSLRPDLHEFQQVYKNIKAVIKKLRGQLTSLVIDVPEPRVHRPLLHSLLIFVQEGKQKLKKLEVTFVDEVRIHNKPVTLQTNELAFISKATKIARECSLSCFKLHYEGKRLQDRKTWMSFISNLNKLESFEMGISPLVDISISIASSILRNNGETLKSMKFIAGPEDFAEYDTNRMDLEVLKTCSVLESLELDFLDNGESLINIHRANFPSSLKKLTLTNFYICLDDVSALVDCMGQNKESTLHLANNWMEGELDIDCDEEDREQYLQALHDVAGKVIAGGNIRCFTLGKVRKIPKLGLPVGPPGELQLIMFQKGKGTIHIHDFKIPISAYSTLSSQSSSSGWSMSSSGTSGGGEWSSEDEY